MNADAVLARLVRAIDAWDADLLNPKADLAVGEELADARTAAAAYLEAIGQDA